MNDVTPLKQSVTKSVIILGDKETGKTNLLQRYVKNKFYENYIETLGVDFFNKEIKIKNENKLSLTKLNFCLNIWDTSGTENENKILPLNLYKNANGFMICCSYDSLATLLNVKTWLTHIKKIINGNKSPPPIFIICNKYDIPLKFKKFGIDEIKSQFKDILKHDENVKIFNEISAKENININLIFEKIVTFSSNSPSFNISTRIHSSLGYLNKNMKSEIIFDVENKNKKSFTLKSDKSQQSIKNKSSSNCCK